MSDHHQQSQQRRMSSHPTIMSTATATETISSEHSPGTQLAASTEQQQHQQHEDYGKENKRPLTSTTSPNEGSQKDRHSRIKEKNNDNSEDDDESIPSWPSKQEQMLARNASSEFIQHKVYSLKDYSQVASPTTIQSSSASSFQQHQHQHKQQQPVVASSSGTSKNTSTTSTGKLLKSMSQDRKVKSGNKRMSECIYPASQISASQSLFNSANNSNSSKQLPTNMSLISNAAKQTTSSGSFSVGQASSINSLLPATAHTSASAGFRLGTQLPTAAASTSTSLMLATGSSGGGGGGCESRIDRMRKLFVSPLSLRSSTSGSTSSSTMAATAPVTGMASIDLANSSTTTTSSHQHCFLQKQREPRLSFQASSGVSIGSGSKPGATASASAAAHHLMHAMHRSAAGSTTATVAAGLAQAMAAHHSRRSPMRQKQTKGFRVYGCPLQMANNIYPITCFGRADIYKQQSVPYVLARLCNYIEENSSQLTHEGIFRVSGNARLMDKLRTLFDHLGDAPLESESVDVATSASMLKMYLRELPEPLIPTRMNYYFITLAKKYAPYLSREQASSTSHALQQQKKYHQQQQEEKQKLQQQQQNQQLATTAGSSSTTSISTGAEESISGTNSISNLSTTNNNNQNSQYVRQRLAFSRDLTKLIRKLPIENYNLLKYLACFLYRISLKQQYNKMCSEALGIVFGPNVFRIRSESYKGLKEQELSNQIMASIISNYKLLFDSELTDPLGNVVDSGNENASVVAAVAVSDAVEQKRKQSSQDQQQQPIAKTILVGDDKRKSTATSDSETMKSSLAAVDLGGVDTETVAGADLLAQAERLARRADSMQSQLISTMPPISASTRIQSPDAASLRTDEQVNRLVQDNFDDNDVRKTCCPGRCKEFIYDADKKHRHLNNNDADEDDDVDVDDDDDDDVDCDDDEEESYTPSSGSGSYCSSMDSQTLESSYDGEIDGNGRKSNRLGGGGDFTSRSTSECASDTSYTPTSSHTDSDVHDADDDDDIDDDEDDEDEDDESFNDQRTNSSRESSVSINNRRLVGSQSTGIYSQGTKVDCRVCKRRESLQFTNLASTIKGSNGCQQTTTIIDASNTTNDTGDQIADDEKNTQERLQPEPVVVETNLGDIQVKQKSPRASGAKVSTSHRRRHVSNKLIDESNTSGDRNQRSPLPISTAIPANGSHQVEPNESKTLSVDQQSQQPSSSSSPDRLTSLEHIAVRAKEARQSSRHSGANAVAAGPSSRSGQRKGNPLFRRRSSSASSLTGRRHRRSSGGDATHHHSNHHHGQRKKLTVLELATGGGGRTSRVTPSAGNTSITGAAGGSCGSKRSRTSGSGGGGGSSRRQHEQHHHHPWDSKRSSRHSMRARNVSKQQTTSGSKRSSAADSCGGHFGPTTARVCHLDLHGLQQVSSAAGSGGGDATVNIGADSLSLNAWSEMFTKQLADEAASFCAASSSTAINYDDSDGPARYFLMRSFNSDETLLRSLNYFSDWPSGGSHQTNIDPNDQDDPLADSMGLDLGFGEQQRRQNAAVALLQRRRHSNFDYINEKPMGSLMPLTVCRPCEQIFEALDMAEEAEEEEEEEESESVSGGDGEYGEIILHKQQNKERKSDTMTVSGKKAKQLFETSTISLLDNKLGFRRSELSMNNLNEHSDDMSILISQLRPHHQHHDANNNRLVVEDAILVQMMATKDLIRTLKRLLKLGRNRESSSSSSSSSSVFSIAMEKLLLKFANSEEETNLATVSNCKSSIVAGISGGGGGQAAADWSVAYSDDCLASYADYLSTRGFIDQLKASAASIMNAAKNHDDESGVVCSKAKEESAVIDNNNNDGDNKFLPSSASTTNCQNVEQLCKILNVKITLFEQKYNDLKNIRNHYLRHHTNGASLVSSVLDSLAGRRHLHDKRDSDEEGLAKKERVHGSLDTLKMQQKQQQSQSHHHHQHHHLSQQASPIATADSLSTCSGGGHRSRILSVPNRNLLVNSESSSGGRSRSAMDYINKDRIDPKEILMEMISPAGNENEKESASKSNNITNQTTGNNNNCKFGSLCPVEFVFNIEKQLALKRVLGNRVIKLNQMNGEQLQSEKIELQKNLLRYEHWFGRPVTRLEFGLIGHLYERYRAVKMIKQRKAQQQQQE